jgi:hypothetical protein
LVFACRIHGIVNCATGELGHDVLVHGDKAGGGSLLLTSTSGVDNGWMMRSVMETRWYQIRVPTVAGAFGRGAGAGADARAGPRGGSGAAAGADAGASGITSLKVESSSHTEQRGPDENAVSEVHDCGVKEII